MLTPRLHRLSVLLQLSAIWIRTLESARFHPWSNFFQVGGDSLAALSCAEAIQRRLGVEPTLDQLFQSSLYRLSGLVCDAMQKQKPAQLGGAFLFYLETLRGISSRPTAHRGGSVPALPAATTRSA